MPKKKKKTPEQQAAGAPGIRKLEYKGLVIAQSTSNHHIMIGKNGKRVFHAQVDRPLTDDELRKEVDDYLVLAERMGLSR